MRRFHSAMLIPVVIGIIASVLWAFTSPGVTEAAQTAQRLRVVTKSLPPFVVVGPEGDVSGFSIQLWKEIATRAGLEFDFLVV